MYKSKVYKTILLYTFDCPDIKLNIFWFLLYYSGSTACLNKV